MKINELDNAIAERQEVVVIFSTRGLRHLLPLYRVDPPEDDRPSFVVGISWGARSNESPRYEVIHDHDVHWDDEVGNVGLAFDIPWWAKRPAPDLRNLPQGAITSRRDGEHATLVVGRWPLEEIAMLEAVAVAARLRMVCRFVYQKPGAPSQDRHARLSWVGGRDGNLVGGEDLDRPTENPDHLGQPRSYRVDRIRAIEFRDDLVPEWRDGRWQVGGGTP